MLTELTEPLPSSLDARKAASRGVTVSGILQPAAMERLRESLASNAGRIEAEIRFFRDEEHRAVVSVALSANLEITCQRCLEAMPVEISSHNELAVISNDEQARALPASLDPLIVEGESCNLWALVEEELILGLPIVSYHDTADCRQLLEDYSRPVSGEQEQSAGSDNPFKVLEQLKSGNHQEN